MLINHVFTIIIGVVLASQINGLPLSKPKIYRQKPYENPIYVEGDMVYPPSLLKPTARGVLRRGSAVAWPNGIVPYQFYPGYGPSQEAFIIHVMEKMERKIAINDVKCVQFRPRIPSDQYYISFENGDGCSSPVGQMADGSINHTVTINYPGCFDDARIMHELLHTLGFLHEQSRPDRDNYVKINFDNIDPDLAYNFDIYDSSLVNTQNTPYDYASVMHYEPDAFSSNGLPTIEALQPNVTFGQRYNMSTIDIEEVRLFYNCSSRGVTFPPMPTTTTANLYAENVTLSSSLTTNSEALDYFSGQFSTHYYGLFEVIASVGGDYIFKTNSSIDTYGIIYKDNFYADSPGINAIFGDNDGGGNLQFQIKLYLKPNARYVLLITTTIAEVIGNFNLIISGLNQVSVRQINSSSIIPTTTSTTVPMPDPVFSTYSSALTNKSSVYSRFGGVDKYYYEAIMISVPETGYYLLYSYSSIDTFGYLYSNSFDPLNIEKNLLTGDDDKANDFQFLLQHEFKSTNTYILIVTTHDQLVLGSFSIFAAGSKPVKFTSMRDVTTQSPSTTVSSAVTTMRNVTTQSPSTTVSSSATKSNVIIIPLLIYIAIDFVLKNLI